MLLVPRQVGFTVLLQPEVKRTLLMIVEALVRVHIGSSAVSYCWLHENYGICKLTWRVMKPKNTDNYKSNDNPTNGSGQTL